MLKWTTLTGSPFFLYIYGLLPYPYYPYARGKRCKKREKGLSPFFMYDVFRLREKLAMGIKMRYKIYLLM